MTSADLNDLVPAQEKLEWITPKISLMGAGDAEGSNKANTAPQETTSLAFFCPAFPGCNGPS